MLMITIIGKNLNKLIDHNALLPYYLIALWPLKIKEMRYCARL